LLNEFWYWVAAKQADFVSNQKTPNRWSRVVPSTKKIRIPPVFGFLLPNRKYSILRIKKRYLLGHTLLKCIKLIWCLL